MHRIYGLTPVALTIRTHFTILCIYICKLTLDIALEHHSTASPPFVTYSSATTQSTISAPSTLYFMICVSLVNPPPPNFPHTLHHTMEFFISPVVYNYIRALGHMVYINVWQWRCVNYVHQFYWNVYRVNRCCWCCLPNDANFRTRLPYIRGVTREGHICLNAQRCR